MKKNYLLTIFLATVIFLIAGFLAFDYSYPESDGRVAGESIEKTEKEKDIEELKEKAGGKLRYTLNQKTGAVSFITSADNHLPLELPKDEKAAKDEKVLADKFVDQYGNYFGLKDPKKELKFLKKESDSLGMKHVRYNQTYKGVPVFGGQMIVHFNKDSSVRSANGNIVPDISIDTDPKIKKDEAEKIAKKLWKEQKKPNDPETLKTNLYVFNKSLFQNKPGDTKDYLVWQVDLYKFTPLAHEYYFVSAQDGKLIYQITGMQDAIHRHIYDCSYGDGNCYMDATDPFPPNYTYGRSEGQPARGPQPILGLSDTDNLYARTGLNYNYYSSKFSLNGANGLGGMGDGDPYPSGDTTGVTFIDYYWLEGGNCPNSWFDGYYSIHFCKGETTHDIVGHEYAHAVNFFAILDGNGDPAGLTYSGQPGALNENNSDVFGTALEYDSEGAGADWLFGEDSLEGASRDMSMPSNLTYNVGGGEIPYPNKFMDSHYYCGTSDNNGVHLNSSVPNHAAYLMAMGGTYNGCTISGIGRAKEEAIFYRAQTVYYITSTNFNGAYDALIAACGDLYGGTSSTDCINVRKALQAVEMDQPGYCSGQAEVTAGCVATTPSTIYRFWSDSKQHHFYTISAAEKDYVIATWPSIWSYEGAVYEAFTSEQSDKKPIYRFWSDSKQGHFYTISAAEKNYVIATWPTIWTYEGVAYYAYESSVPNSTPIYRFWSDSKQGHFYTASEDEKNYVIATWPDIWHYEGIAWYVPQ